MPGPFICKFLIACTMLRLIRDCIPYANPCMFFFPCRNDHSPRWIDRVMPGEKGMHHTFKKMFIIIVIIIN